jgi:hypothetical protein
MHLYNNINIKFIYYYKMINEQIESNIYDYLLEIKEDDDNNKNIRCDKLKDFGLYLLGLFVLFIIVIVFIYLAYIYFRSW